MIELDLEGKRALVCGASQGIGRACAMELADLGADITLLARNQGNLEQVATKLSTRKQQHHQILCMDLENLDLLEKNVAQNIAQYGSFDILINNSGGPKPGPISTAPIQSFQAALDSHLKASILLSQLLIPGMKEKQYGRIINITSTSIKTPLENLGVSNTVRWAVTAWAKTLSYEIAQYGITVNTVLPGSIDTDRQKNIIHEAAKKQSCSDAFARKQIESTIPAGYIGTTKQLADVVAFLASPAASYINGVALAVDGGRTRSL